MTKAEQIYGEGYSSREDFVKQVVAENKPSKLVVNFLVNRIADLKEEIAKLRDENKMWQHLLDEAQPPLNIQEKTNNPPTLGDILEIWRF